MLDAVLFELEGVLAETREARCVAAVEALERDGVSVERSAFDEYAARRPVRAGIAALLAARGEPRDDVMLDLLTIDAERRFGMWLSKGVTLTPGAESLVRGFQGSARLAVVTRATRYEAGLMLSLAGLGDAFECVVCDEDAAPPKPSSAPYRTAMARLARHRPVRPDRVVALEDGQVGIRAARGAGIRCAAVGAMLAHEAMEADALIPSLAGLSPLSLTALVATD